MRSLIPLIAVVALCCGCGRKTGDVGVASKDVGPQLRVPEPSYNFGPSTEGDKLKHVFVLENSGSAPLNLERVATNCPCVTAEIKQKQIMPGGKGEVEVVFDTLKRPGDLDKSLTVFPGPNLSPVELRVRTQVDPLLAVRGEEEEEEEDEDMHFGETGKREFEIIGKKATEAQLVVERVTNPLIKAEIEKENKDGKVKVELKVTIEGSQLGHQHGGVFMSTGIAQAPKLVHFFEWNVLGNITTVPSSVHFEYTSDGDVSGGNEQVAVFTSRAKDFEIKSVKSSSPVFKAEAKKNKDGYELHVRVVDKKGLSQISSANIEVTSNDKVEPKKVFPVSISRALPGIAAAPASSAAPKL